MVIEELMVDAPLDEVAARLGQIFDATPRPQGEGLQVLHNDIYYLVHDADMEDDLGIPLSAYPVEIQVRSWKRDYDAQRAAAVQLQQLMSGWDTMLVHDLDYIIGFTGARRAAA